MATKTVLFHVEVRNAVITSGTYEVQGIVNKFVGAAASKTAFQGNSFIVELKENESEHFAVTVLIQDYTIDGVAHKAQDKPINLLATFYLPAAGEVKVCPESSIASIYSFARMTTVNNDGLVTKANCFPG